VLIGGDDGVEFVVEARMVSGDNEFADTVRLEVGGRVRRNALEGISPGSLICVFGGRVAPRGDGRDFTVVVLDHVESSTVARDSRQVLLALRHPIQGVRSCCVLGDPPSAEGVKISGDENDRGALVGIRVVDAFKDGLDHLLVVVTELIIPMSSIAS
jgi:hypothetical protein